MKKINKEKSSKYSSKENDEVLNQDDEVLNLNKELEDLININESLKIGLSKMFKEIEKKNITNNSK